MSRPIFWPSTSVTITDLTRSEINDSSISGTNVLAYHLIPAVSIHYRFIVFREQETGTERLLYLFFLKSIVSKEGENSPFRYSFNYIRHSKYSHRIRRVLHLQDLSLTILARGARNHSFVVAETSRRRLASSRNFQTRTTYYAALRLSGVYYVSDNVCHG